MISARIWARIQAAADETGAAFQQEAFSPSISLEGEAASIVCGPGGVGWTHGSSSSPFYSALLSVWVDVWKGWKEATQPGTVYVSNDPYCGGSTLCDLRMVTPIFFKGQLVCLVACAGRYGDFGGRIIGGVCPGATAVQQEGLRVVSTSMVQSWVMDLKLANVLAHNCRFPEIMLGDLQAQIDGLRTGAERMLTLFDRYGTGPILESAEFMAFRTRQAMNSAVSEFGKGKASCLDRLDGAGLPSNPLQLCLRIDAEQRKLHFDFTGSSFSASGPVNCSFDAVRVACILGVRHFFPELPRHSSISKWIRVTVPEQSFLNAKFPQPVGGATLEVVPRIVSGIFEIFSSRLHGRGQVGGGGGANLIVLQGKKKGKPYLMRLNLCGGGGASGRGDGLSNCNLRTRFSSFPSLEQLERDYPIRVKTYKLRAESGGAGRYIGGMGSVFEFELLEEIGLLTIFYDRNRRGPGGARKGARGATTEVILRRKGNWLQLTNLSKVEDICLKKGDRLVISSAGGGGYGHPYERAIRLLSKDMKSGFLSRREAAMNHGVVYQNEDGTDYDSNKTFRLRNYKLTIADIEGILDEIQDMDSA